MRETEREARRASGLARRAALGLLLVAGAGVVAAARGAIGWRRRRRERALAEADLRAPHDLAG
jgi:hypothetical protein